MTSKQVTSPPWNSRRLVHSKEMVWASRWSVALRAFYRQILSLTYRFFSLKLPPRLVRALLVNVYMDPMGNIITNAKIWVLSLFSDRKISTMKLTSIWWLYLVKNSGIRLGCIFRREWPWYDMIRASCNKVLILIDNTFSKFRHISTMQNVDSLFNSSWQFPFHSPFVAFIPSVRQSRRGRSYVTEVSTLSVTSRLGTWSLALRSFARWVDIQKMLGG